MREAAHAVAEGDEDHHDDDPGDSQGGRRTLRRSVPLALGMALIIETKPPPCFLLVQSPRKRGNVIKPRMGCGVCLISTAPAYVR